MRRPEDRARQLRAMGMVSTIGLVLVICTGIGYFGGAWVDRRFGTEYWSIVGFLVGVTAGFREMLRIVQQATEENEQ